MTLTADAGDSDALHRRLAGAEAKAALLDQWLGVIFETSPQAMGVISTFENRYVQANHALAELYGMSREEILGTDPFSMALRLTHPDDLVTEQKLFAELAVGARRSYRIEKRYVRPDGSIRWGLLSFSGIFDTPAEPAASVGALRFVVIQVIDISDQKAVLETLERREAELRHAQKIDGIGRLAAGVAHDFNNLLTVIMGHAEALKCLVNNDERTPPSADLYQDVQAILSASERAASLTAQLLAYGRRESVAPRTLVLSDAIERLQRLLGRTLGSSVEIEQSLTAIGSIFTDEGQIGQIAMNLVFNARDALPEGGRIGLGTRDVTVRETAANGALPGLGEWVALVVSDAGHGMSPEIQEQMFEPFFTTRADRPGTQGTGLGLATVQRIVVELGGCIDVRSAPSEGTTVTVFFPRVAAIPKGPELARVQPRPAAAPNSVRVLVVEDEPQVRSLIANVLLGAHYWVMVARNGEEAFEFIAAEREPFHLIVTDLLMPRTGGLSLAKLLHERADKPRMLFVSGYNTHTPIELAPYGHLLPKPFTRTQLLDAVARTLQESPAARGND